MFPYVILCRHYFGAGIFSLYKVIIPEKRRKLEAENMDMILVTYCADNLGMIVMVKFVWRCILKMTIFSFLLFIVHFCGGGDDNNNNHI
jgi:hypothetical protein